MGALKMQDRKMTDNEIRGKGGIQDWNIAMTLNEP